MSDTEAEASTARPVKKPWPRPIRILVRLAVVGTSVLAILLLVIVAPDQLRTPVPPAPALPESVRALLQSAPERSAEKDSPDADRSALAGNAQESADPHELGMPATLDPQVEDLVRGFLPIQDLASVSPENQEAARRLNDSVSREVRDLVALLKESPTSPFDSAIRRLWEISKAAADQWSLEEAIKGSRLNPNRSRMKILEQCMRVSRFEQQAGVQIALDHQEFLYAGALCTELDDWNGSAYCWQKAGLKGRAALAGLSVYLRYKQVDDAVARYWANYYKNR